MVKEELVEVEVETEIVSTQTIKPSSPTPDHLRKFMLSVHDQFTPHIYTPLVLLFAAGKGQESFDERSRRLRSSLAGALAQFYPLAGRVLEDELYVDCNDEGAEYVEAKVNGCRLSDILVSPDDKVLRKFLPSFAPASGSGRALLVQVNAFECGGMAVGACVSHKITDAFSMSVFLKSWAAVARGEAVEAKDIDAIASHFPAIPISASRSPVDLAGACKCVTRRYVLDGKKITALKEKAASSSVVKPTRVEAVSALIWKCIVNALNSRPGHKTRPSVIAQSVELRKRMYPPFPEYSLGNMVGSFFVEASGQDHDHDHDFDRELQEMTVQLRTKLRDVTEDYVTKLHGDGALAAICETAIKYGAFLMRQDIDFYIFSSWCRMGLYDTDFGWGKAAWIGTINISDVKNAVILMDTRDGDGIEAIVTLPEKDMAFFETNRELLEFASSKPTVNDRTD